VRFPLRLLLILVTATAGFLPGSAAAEETPARKNTVLILPMAYYTPETRLAAGLGGILAFRPAAALSPQAKSKAATRPTSFLFSAVYTQNNQFTVQMKPEIYWHREDWVLTGSAEWSRFPSKFFGLGNDAPEEAGELMTPIQILTEVQLQRRIVPGSSLYGGIMAVLESYRFRSFEPDGLLDSECYEGSGGGTLAGVGLVAKIDSRDNVFAPRRGRFWQVSAVFHGGILGGDWSFSKLKADLRSYLPIGASTVLGFQAKLESVAGNAPFMALPKLGSDGLMRGYLMGRYRDKVFAGAQAEARFPLTGRFGAALFAGIGEVAGRLGDLSLTGLKPSVGGGLRFRISDEGNTIRIDFGYGRSGSGVYFTANEAF
jgi:outer membrane protein assembly factor BamA